MMYVAHIAWSLGLILVAAGFAALHFAVRESSAHLKTAGWLLVIGGALGLVCNGYYSLKYLQQGAFETPIAMHQANMMPMQGGMMQGGMMQNGAMPQGMTPGNATPDHHPASPPSPQ